MGAVNNGDLCMTHYGQHGWEQSTIVISMQDTVWSAWMGAVNNGDLCRTHYGLHGWEQSTMVIYVGHTMVCMDGSSQQW